MALSIILLFLLATMFSHPFSVSAQASNPTAHVTVVGVVYCDTCSTNVFSRHSYFLPGADVHIQCEFKADSPKTAEHMTFTVNRTTDRHGIYRMEIPEVDGVDCVNGMVLESLCQASLKGSSVSDCNVPALRVTTNEMSVKSKQDNLCIYSLKALSYRPSKKNKTLCGNQKEEEIVPSSFNSSKFFLPYFPSYGFPWPQLPPMPPLPQLPPLPRFPSPPVPPLPSFAFPHFPFSNPPSLPFPFAPLPPYHPIPFAYPPPLPSFPFPHFPFPNPPSLSFPFPPLPPYPPIPFAYPPPPPAFSLGDPRTWVPNFPPLSPPPSPPAFNLGNPRTWNPYFPPSPPHMLERQSP